MIRGRNMMPFSKFTLPALDEYPSDNQDNRLHSLMTMQHTNTQSHSPLLNNNQIKYTIYFITSQYYTIIN